MTITTKSLQDMPVYANLQTARSLSIKLTEQIYENGLTASDIMLAQNIGKSLASIIFKEKNFHEVIKSFRDYEPFRYNHPFMIAVIALMICKRLEWTNPRTSSSICLGAFLLDIGKTAIPEDIRDMDISCMDEGQFEVYKTHPAVGMRMVSAFSEVPASVYQIILQHHEGDCGKGFPNGISNNKVYPLAKVINLADTFSKILFNNKLAPMDGLRFF